MMPMRVIGMLLGIPEAGPGRGPRHDRREPAHRSRASRWTCKKEQVASGDMFADYIEWRAEHPSDDLMTQLLNAEFEDEHGETRTLTRQEVLTYTAVIAGAGNETTGRLIGWLAKVLAEHPDQRRAVVEDRSLIPNVIDETLRFEPTGPRHRPLRHAGRRVLRHHRARRQPDPAARWRRPTATRAATTNPDVYDIHRDDIQHLTFGFGLHFCLGANLARLEGARRARRAAQPFPRVGHRLRRHRSSRRRRPCAAGSACRSSSRDPAPTAQREDET